MDERTESDSKNEALQALVADCLDRMEREGSRALDAFCAEHADHASAIRQRVEMLQAMGLVGSGSEHPEDDAFPERLGDFRLLRRLGGGGMGVVYLAIQESLGREVALKLVRPETLYFPGARERFRREAEAVARLQHPSIVPVFTVGEEKGIPFFAMERVHGVSLSTVIAKLAGKNPSDLGVRDFAAALDACLRESGVLAATDPPVDPDALGRSLVEACFRIALQAAEALEHAHSRGVLHRDMKPSNLMITADGRVRLVDFGLAVLQGSERITRSGSQLGSMAYMPPEQVRGLADQIGAPSDVYSLGATLYETLALVAPFEDTYVDALQLRILTEPPTPLQRINGTIPWDAETVCLTTLEKDPARRYATATEFANDLRNVLELRPIRAKRPGPLLRMRRFAQRHPAWTVTALLGTLVVLGGPLGYAIQQKSAHAAIEKEKDRAEANLDRAFEAVDRMLVRLSDERLVRIPRMATVRSEVLKDALSICQQALQSQTDSVDAQYHAAEMYRRVANIETSLGELDAAISAYESAERLFATSLSRFPNAHSGRLALAILRWKRARALHEAGRDAQSMPLWHESLDAIAAIAGEQPDDLDALTSLAQCANDLAGVEVDFGKRDESLALRRRSLAAIDQVLARTPDDPDAQFRKASYLANLGCLLQTWGRSDDAEPSLRQAAAALDVLYRAHPDDDSIQHLFAETHNGLGQVLYARGAGDEALREYKSATDMARTILLQNPAVLQNREQMLQMLILNGAAALELAPLQDAAALLEEGEQHARRLVAEVPKNASYRAMFADVIGGLADARLKQDRIDDAVALYREAVGVLASLASEQPDSEAHRINLAFDRDRLASIAEDRKDLAEAARLRSEALADLREARRLFPDLQNAHDLTYTISIHHANVLYQLGDHRAMRQTIADLDGVNYDAADMAYRCGSVLLNAAELAQKDARLDAAERARLVDGDIAGAAARFAKAKELGQPDVGEFLKGPIVAPWREDPRIAKLIGE